MKMDTVMMGRVPAMRNSWKVSLFSLRKSISLVAYPVKTESFYWKSRFGLLIIEIKRKATAIRI